MSKLLFLRCGELASQKSVWERRADGEARAQMTRIMKEIELHEAEHLREREYAEDIWFKGEEHPHRVTAMSMDAPTETQFDIPVQNRTNRDVVKSLADCRKWSSKIMGVLIAGMGIRAYTARSGLCGGGGNLSATCLYLSLIAMVKAGRPLGTILNTLLDNTGADNKNFTVICFFAWLVQKDVFEEAGFFCMQKGHTYSRIDQCFRTLIRQLMGEEIWTVESLIHFIFKFLQPYDCLSVSEMPHLWDWDNFFKPHVDKKLKGFATGQFGSGMHEVLIRKDHEGVVRVWFRASSQASNWLPEGQGYSVFKSVPVGQPPIARGKHDYEWKREKVEETVRRWFRFMNVDQHEARRIRETWDKRFSSLPPDGDFSLMRDMEVLEWMDLPKQTPRRPCNAFDRSCKLSLSLHLRCMIPLSPVCNHVQVSELGMALRIRPSTLLSALNEPATMSLENWLHIKQQCASRDTCLELRLQSFRQIFCSSGFRNGGCSCTVSHTVCALTTRLNEN